MSYQYQLNNTVTINNLTMKEVYFYKSDLERHGYVVEVENDGDGMPGSLAVHHFGKVSEHNAETEIRERFAFLKDLVDARKHPVEAIGVRAFDENGKVIFFV